MRGTDIPTKKADLSNKAERVERGRFADLLEPGFVVEITPSKHGAPLPSTQPKPAGPKR